MVQLNIPHKVVARAKITRADGSVEYAEIPADQIEVYMLPDGTLSSTYPATTSPQGI